MPTCRFDRFVREQIAGDLLAADSLARPPPSDRSRPTFLMLGQHQPRRAGQAPARHGRGRRAARHDRQGHSSARRSAAPAATTTSSTRSPRGTTTPWPASSASTKALEHANVSKWLEVPLPVSAERGGRAQAPGSGGRGPRGPAQGREVAAGPRRAGHARAVAGRTRPGIVVDDTQGAEGRRVDAVHVQRDLHRRRLPARRQPGKGEKTLTFQPELPEAGSYEVWLAYSPGSNRSAAVPVTVLSADGEDDGPRRHESIPADRRPVRLAGPVPVREERPGVRPDRERGDDRARRGRRRAASSRRATVPAIAACGRAVATARCPRWRPS